MDSNVNALAVLPNGDLIAGGNFTSAGGTLASRVARLNPGMNTWLPIGSGVFGNVYTLASMPNGDLVAGGLFTTAGPTTVNYVARWSASGSTWAALGSGVNNTVWSLTTLPGGDLAVGGVFATAGGTAANGVARWSDTGGGWSALGTGSGATNGKVSTLLISPSGELYAGGYFSTLIGGSAAPYFARYSSGGTTPSVIAQPESLTACPSGFVPFEVTAIGTAPLTYQWQWRNLGVVPWSDIIDGPNVEPGGSPAFIAIGSGTSRVTMTNSVGTLTAVSGGRREIRVVVANSCAGVTSDIATWTICPGDFDCDGFVTGDDFDQYVAAFETGAINADFDGDGFVTGDDFDLYVTAFEAGC